MPKKVVALAEHPQRRHDDAQRRLMKAASVLHDLSSANIDRACWEQIGFLLSDLELAHRDIGETL